MNTAIILDEKHFQAATEKARSLGTTPERYIQSLIDAADLTFDEILAPVRQGFRESGVTEDELDDAVNRARKDIGKNSSRASET